MSLPIPARETAMGMWGLSNVDYTLDSSAGIKRVMREKYSHAAHYMSLSSALHCAFTTYLLQNPLLFGDSS
jgi:hypothetical protein